MAKRKSAAADGVPRPTRAKRVKPTTSSSSSLECSRFLRPMSSTARNKYGSAITILDNMLTARHCVLDAPLVEQLASRCDIRGTCPRRGRFQALFMLDADDIEGGVTCSAAPRKQNILDELRDALAYAADETRHVVLLMLRASQINHNGRKLLDSQRAARNRSYEVFDLHAPNMLFDVTRHFLQPLSFRIYLDTPADMEARRRVVRRYCNRSTTEMGLGGTCTDVSCYHLPKVISNVDVIAKYFNLEPGEIYQIVRKSPTVGPMVTYRVAIDENKNH